MVRLNWTIQAVNDLKEIADYISKDSARYAGLLVKRIHSRTKILKSQPVSGRVVPEFERADMKELFEGNYRIIYQIMSSGQVVILTIHHSAKRLKPSQLK
jgi:addiction module RelE/StbE family toxin